MPIYEFFCGPCNTVFSFFSRSVDTEKVPLCPRCCGLLSRRMSPFSVAGARPEEEGEGAPAFDEARMERAMAELARRAGGLDENDPAQSAGLLRTFSDIAGMKLSGGMEEAMRRMEAGEDPEAVEADMAGLLESEPFAAAHKTGRARKAPARDEKLYDL